MRQTNDTLCDYDERYSRVNNTLWQMAAEDRQQVATLGDIGARFGLSTDPTAEQIIADLSAMKRIVERSLATNATDFSFDLGSFRAYTYATYLDGRDGGTRVTQALERLLFADALATSLIGETRAVRHTLH